jgi:D-lactate dehydrogenase
MTDVIFYEAFAEEEQSLRKHIDRNLKIEFRQNALQSYKETAPPAPLISIRTHSRIPDSWIKEVKGVLTRSSGFDHLQEFFKKTDGTIPCGYLSEYSARSVAEHAITVMLSLFKILKKQIEHFDTFNRNGITCRDCHARNLLVVGVGKIGSQIARLGKGLDMHVKGVDLIHNVKGLEYVDLEKGLPWADAVICALPLTDQTDQLLNYSVLKHVKKNAVFVNISRCEISPLEGLNRLLTEGVLGGIGLDVFEQEGLLLPQLQGRGGDSNDYQKLVIALKDQPNVIFTPHNAFNTEESLDRKSQRSCEAINKFLKTNRFPDEVKR